jgi:hypothetical protein
MENWKDIKNFEGLYKISDNGRVKSLHKKRHIFLKPRLSHDGYLRVSLSKNGKRYEKRVHQIVIKHFGNKNIKETVNHIDGNKENNNINNLEYCTRKENMKHAYKLGLKKIVDNSILNDKEVREIRKMYKSHSKEFGGIALSKKYNVSIATILRIIRKATYKNIQ